MSELISGKDALNAWFDGETVFVNFGKDTLWHDFEKDTNCSAEIFKNEKYKFRLKPCTITINGVEVPAPFEPEKGECFYHIAPSQDEGYFYNTNECFHQFGAWRTAEEIKQVVAALREVFK